MFSNPKAKEDIDMKVLARMIDGPLITSLKNSVTETDYCKAGFLYVILTLEKLLKFTFECSPPIYTPKNEKI